MSHRIGLCGVSFPVCLDFGGLHKDARIGGMLIGAWWPFGFGGFGPLRGVLSTRWRIFGERCDRLHLCPLETVVSPPSTCLSVVALFFRVWW